MIRQAAPRGGLQAVLRARAEEGQRRRRSPRRPGISKGAFYLFYESKEALFMEVVEMVEKRFRQEMLAAVDLRGQRPAPVCSSC